MTDEAIGKLREIARSRTEASRVARAQMLVRYAEKPSFYAVGQRLGVHHQTVQRCVERALAYGPLAARARPEQSIAFASRSSEVCLNPAAQDGALSIASARLLDQQLIAHRNRPWAPLPVG